MTFQGYFSKVGWWQKIWLAGVASSKLLSWVLADRFTKHITILHLMLTPVVKLLQVIISDRGFKNERVVVVANQLWSDPFKKDLHYNRQVLQTLQNRTWMTRTPTVAMAFQDSPVEVSHEHLCEAGWSELSTCRDYERSWSQERHLVAVQLWQPLWRHGIHWRQEIRIGDRWVTKKRLQFCCAVELLGEDFAALQRRRWKPSTIGNGTAGWQLDTTGSV